MLFLSLAGEIKTAARLSIAASSMWELVHYKILIIKVLTFSQSSRSSSAASIAYKVVKLY